MIAISHAHAAKPQRKVDRASHPEDTVIDLGGGVKIGGGHFQVIAGPCSVEGDNLLTIAARCRAAGATLLRGGVIDLGGGVKIGGGHFQVIAGPCSVEGDNLLTIAARCRAAGATLLRGGAYKPRTSPYDHQGMGERGLDLLLEARAQTGMPIVSEVMDTRDVELFVNRGIDVMQIGARNAQNFALLKEVGRTKTPVLLKRGMASTLEELLMAAEYIMSEGNERVILCERGIRTFETATRNTFDPRSKSCSWPPNTS